jgi:hypothetical protein
MPWYNTGKTGWMTGALCLWSSTTASFYATLVRASYVPAVSHVYASAFSGSELSSVSFTAGFNGTGRLSLTSRLVNANQTSNQCELQAATLTWAGLSAGTAAAMIIFQQSGTDALSPLVGYTCAGGFPVVTNGTNLTISFTSAGVLDITD